jgi:uncharacterized DUF497 family protein
MRKAVWDPAKARANLLKHGVGFSDAVGVLFDPLAVTKEDTTSTGEQRFVRVGSDYRGRVIVVVHTVESVSRIISARRATRKERSKYEEGL